MQISRPIMACKKIQCRRVDFEALSLRVHEAARQSIQIAAVPQGRQEDREAFDPVAQGWQQAACRNLV